MCPLGHAQTILMNLLRPHCQQKLLVQSQDSFISKNLYPSVSGFQQCSVFEHAVPFDNTQHLCVWLCNYLAFCLTNLLASKWSPKFSIILINVPITPSNLPHLVILLKTNEKTKLSLYTYGKKCFINICLQSSSQGPRI